MDKNAAKTVLQELLKQHPELAADFIQAKPIRPAAERKPVSTTVRTNAAVKQRIEALVPRLQGTNHIDHRGEKLKCSDVIREALERGVRELERVAEDGATA